MKEWVYALSDCLDMLKKELGDEDIKVKDAVIIQDEIMSLQSLLDFVQGYLYGKKEGKSDA